MLPPDQDLSDRVLIWDCLQDLWMDTDSGPLLPKMMEVCASSKYTLGELEEIYWNELHPALSFNTWLLPAPEWAGFESGWLTARILEKNRYGKPVPWMWLHPFSNASWRKLRAGIAGARGESAR